MKKITKKDYRGEKALRILSGIAPLTPTCCYKTEEGEKEVVLLDGWSVPYDETYCFWQYKKVTYLLKRGRRPRVIVSTELFTSSACPHDIISNMRGGVHWERFTVGEAIAALDYIG